MATSLNKNLSRPGLQHQDAKTRNLRSRDPLALTSSSYGGVTLSSTASPTIFMHPLRAEPTTLRNDTTSAYVGKLPTQPIAIWDEEARLIGAEILKSNTLEPLAKCERLRDHGHLMYERLTFHKNNFKGWFPDPIWMVGKSFLLGPSFTEQWSDEWKVAKFRMLNMKFNIEPDKEPGYQMSDYSSTYLAHHFVFWREDDAEDYLNMLGDPPDVDEEALDRLEQYCAELSEKYLTLEQLTTPPPKDYIYRTVPTAGFDGDSIKAAWEIEFDNPRWDTEEEICIAARSRAPKRPGETRDIGILKPNSLHFHRKFMFPLKLLCNKLPDCPYGQTVEHLRNIVSRFGRQKQFFYMRDYTKSGMTIPHEVQQAVLRGVFRRAPEIYQKCYRFYSNQQLFLKKGDEYELVKPTTGSPLGLFVEGYTIFQYALHKMNLEDIGARASSLKFSATNDDMVVGGSDRDQVELYLNADSVNNTLLGMQYKDTKSGISENRFVYCEEYWMGNHIDPKECLFAVSMIGAKFAVSAFHAKEYCYAIMLASAGLTPVLQRALHEVQAFIGYEFHEDEFNWPYHFGGWLPQIKDGLDYSIEWYDGDLRAEAGYWASISNLPQKGKLDEKGHLTLSRIYDLTLVKEPEDRSKWVDLVPLLGTKKALTYHYRSGHGNPMSVFHEYIKLQRIRVSIFNKFLSGKLEKPLIYKDYITRHPNSVIPRNYPGVKYAEGFTRVEGPRLTSVKNGFEVKLKYAQLQGYIQTNISEYVSPEMVELTAMGISSSFKYEYIPISEQGISTHLLTTYYPGLAKLYEETGKVPISMFEGDSPLVYSKLWGYMPWASLHTTMRMHKLSSGKFGRDMNNSENLIWAADVHRQVSLKQQEDYEPEDSSSEPEIDTYYMRKKLISDLIYDVVRDWSDNPNEIIEKMQSRIIPITDSSKDDINNPILGFYNHHSVSLLPESPPEAETITNDIASDEEGEVFDPWAELGYD